MSGLLPSECPNCGRLHQGHDFNAEPGPVQARLAEWTLAWNELRLVMAEGSLPWSPHLRRLDELAGGVSADQETEVAR